MELAKKGDLIYIPSDVRLVDKDEFGATIDYILLKKPANLLVVGANNDAYEVLYKQKKWFVEKRNTYGVTYD